MYYQAIAAEINTAEIMVFKTNIKTQQQLENAGFILNKQKNIRKWDIDTEDVDNVLRVSGDMYPSEVIDMLTNAGYHCSELED